VGNYFSSALRQAALPQLPWSLPELCATGKALSLTPLLLPTTAAGTEACTGFLCPPHFSDCSVDY